MTKRPSNGASRRSSPQPPTDQEIAARASMAEEVSGRPMSPQRAYAAGGFAYDRGEPAQPPATIPIERKQAWLKGWADQKSFMEVRKRGEG
jgi:hypothetical protein